MSEPENGGESLPASLPEVGRRLAEVDEIEVVVDKLVDGGDGLARFEGIAIFVPRSAPGDRLRVRLIERKPRYARAEIVEVLAPGPHRREPPCPHFADCGGCDLQHLDDAAQTRLKVEAVVETLRRIGRIATPERVEVLAGEMWAYRRRCQLHTERVPTAEDAPPAVPQVGYFARGSNRLVGVDVCPILAEPLERLLPGLPGILGPEPPRRLDLLAGDDGLSVAPVVEGLPHGAVVMEVGGLALELDARCFFQAHRTLTSELVDRAVGDWSGELAVDLYAGVGLFTVPLAARYERVVAVEGDRVAARYAGRNARRHRLSRVTVVTQAVESWARQLTGDVDRLVVDPPRGGLSGAVRQAVKEATPGRLTYVSCHAATLARDLADLGERYRLESLVFLDMFPQTGHLEVVAQLESTSSRLEQ